MADHLDQIADALYALRPDEFAAARDERIKQARADKRPDLARELAKLRRPTQSAWLINALWRDQHDVLEQLLDLGAELSRAQAQASGPELRTLTAQRREVEAALLQRARELAEKASVNITPSMEREAQETLSAALADPAVADEVRAGRLVKPVEYAGFGTPIVSTPKPRPVAPAAPPPKETDELAERRAQRAQRAQQQRAEAEHRVTQASAAVDTTAQALAERDREARAATAHQQDTEKRLEQARTQVRQLERQLAVAEDAAQAAAQRRQEASDAHEDAQRLLSRAERDLATLPTDELPRGAGPRNPPDRLAPARSGTSQPPDRLAPARLRFSRVRRIVPCTL